MYRSGFVYSPASDNGSANYHLALPIVASVDNRFQQLQVSEKNYAEFLKSLECSDAAETVKTRAKELLSLNPPDRVYDPKLIEQLCSSSVIERAVALGHIKAGAPEIVYASAERQELFELERVRIALRSMEHAQAGRAFNDFRAQLSICVSSLQAAPQYPMPPAARALNVVAAIFGVVLFDAFHQHIERPYVFLPTSEFPEPREFDSGIELFKKLLPSVSILERATRALFDISNNEQLTDLNMEIAAELAQGMLQDLAMIKQSFDLSESSDKFRPSTLEFVAFAAAETVQWLQESVTDKQKRAELIGYVQKVTRAYYEILDLRESRLKQADQSNPEVLNTLRDTVTAKESYHTIDALAFAANQSEIPITPVAWTHEDIELLKWQVLEAAPKSALAREIALDRIQFACGEIELDEVNLSDVIHSLAAQVLPMPGKETLIVQAPTDKQIFVLGNERRLRGALSNIINNAFHYGDTLTITLSHDDKSGQATIELRDNGKGVSEDLLEPGALANRPKIFDLGVTKRELDSADKKKGTGVGTTESFYVFEMHDGTLEVQSERAPSENHGTTFTARIKAYSREISQTDLILEEFEEFIEHELSEVSSELFAEAVAELPTAELAKISNFKFTLRHDGDALNQDFVAFSRQARGTSNANGEIYIPNELLKIEDHGVLKLLLRDFLLPFEIDAQNSVIACEPDPLVRHAALLLRSMDRFRGFSTTTQLGLLEALKLAPIDRSTGRKLAVELEASLTDDLTNRAMRALSWAAAKQLRPLVLRDPISLSRDTIELFELAGPVEVAGAAAAESKTAIEQRFKELCRVFDIQSGTALFRLIRESVLEDKEVPLKPYHRMRYPTDARSMLVYLTEHGLITSVLKKLDVSEIERWRVLSDEVLPLAARVLLPGSDELYESLLDRGGSERWARNLSSSLAQLPLLGTRTLNRMQEVGEFLKSRAIVPLSSEEVSEQEALAVADWVALLDRTAALITASGIDELIYSLDDSENSSRMLNQLSTVAQYRHIRSTLEAREVFPFIRAILEFAADDNDGFLEAKIDGKSVFDYKSFSQHAVELRQYFGQQLKLQASPAHDAVVQQEYSRICDLVDTVRSK